MNTDSNRSKVTATIDQSANEKKLIMNTVTITSNTLNNKSIGTNVKVKVNNHKSIRWKN